MFSTLLTTLPLLADGAAPASRSAGPAAGLTQLLLPAAIMLLFYFILWRPQSRKQKDAQEMLKSLKKGDEVVTTGGLIGKITGMTDTTVTLEVQEKVRVKVRRSHVTEKIGGSGSSAPQPAPAHESATK